MEGECRERTNQDLNTLLTVSYTHLDVYKRQNIDRLTRLAYPEESEDFRKWISLIMFIDGIRDRDVYKRQNDVVWAPSVRKFNASADKLIRI